MRKVKTKKGIDGMNIVSRVIMNRGVVSKGVVSIIELILVVIILFTAFNIFFPGFSYKTGWSEALLLQRSRDIVLTVDRIGRLYEYSFDSSAFETFLDEVISASLITWSDTEGAVKNEILISCNCSDEQMIALSSWLGGLKINGRSINALVCYTELGVINPCIENSDLLLIWGYKPLTDYESQLLSYLKTGNGIVEIMDFDKSVTVDSAQISIFGIDADGSWGSDYDIILKPSDASQVTYKPYKLFYHIPIDLEAPTTAATTQTCDINTTGNFVVREAAYPFWICRKDSSYTVYFDTDGDGIGDTQPLAEGDSFTIQGFEFILKYIEGNERIRVAFSPDYQFVDFVKKPDLSIKKIVPSDGDYGRVLVRMGEPGASNRACGVILNNPQASRTAWVADFTRDGLDAAGDDHRQLLASLLLWASNKKARGLPIGNIRVGYITSYINVNNTDVFEVYKLNFGIGYPF